VVVIFQLISLKFGKDSPMFLFKILLSDTELSVYLEERFRLSFAKNKTLEKIFQAINKNIVNTVIIVTTI
jgi:hypothetical protein